MTEKKAGDYLLTHPEFSSKWCGDQYPVKSDSVVVTVRDTVKEKNQEIDLTDFADSVINKAYKDKDQQISDMSDYIDALEKSNGINQKDAIGLRAQLKNIKPVDTAALNKAATEKIKATIKACEETTTRVVSENTAKATAQTLRGDREQAAKEKMTGSRDWWRKVAIILAVILGLWIGLKILKASVPALQFLKFL